MLNYEIMGAEEGMNLKKSKLRLRRKVMLQKRGFRIQLGQASAMAASWTQSPI